jgi:hypothetical protein
LFNGKQGVWYFFEESAAMGKRREVGKTEQRSLLKKYGLASGRTGRGELTVIWQATSFEYRSDKRSRQISNFQ